MWDLRLGGREETEEIGFSEATGLVSIGILRRGGRNNIYRLLCVHGLF